MNETTLQMQQRHKQEINDFEGLFFAFSNKQLEEGKAKVGVTDNKELVSIGSGGFMPKSRAKAFADMFKRHRQERKEHRERKKTIKIKFVGIDDWNRPVFKSINKPYRFYGDVYNLFDYGDTEQTVLAKINEDCLCYFGDHFGCEPMGTDTGNIKIVTSKDLLNVTN